MRRALLGVGALAALAVSAEGAPPSIAEARREASRLDRPLPGLYRQTMTISRFEIPGIEPGELVKLRRAMAEAQVHSFCLTAEASAKGFREMFDKIDRDDDCRYDRFDVIDDRLGAVMHCRNPREGEGTITIFGTVTPDGSDVEVAIEQRRGTPPTTASDIVLRLTSQRVGACPPAPSITKRPVRSGTRPAPRRSSH